jgi:hypothetical protein
MEHLEKDKKENKEIVRNGNSMLNYLHSEDKDLRNKGIEKVKETIEENEKLHGEIKILEEKIKNLENLGEYYSPRRRYTDDQGIEHKVHFLRKMAKRIYVDKKIFDKYFQNITELIADEVLPEDDEKVKNSNINTIVCDQKTYKIDTDDYLGIYNKAREEGNNLEKISYGLPGIYDFHYKKYEKDNEEK